MLLIPGSEHFSENLRETPIFLSTLDEQLFIVSQTSLCLLILSKFLVCNMCTQEKYIQDIIMQ